jgi:hypothetical protein
MYFLFPIIIIPIAAYVAPNWWLLLGIPIFYLAVFIPNYILLVLAIASVFVLIATHFNYWGYYVLTLFIIVASKYLFLIPQKYKVLEDVYKQKAMGQVSEGFEKEFL